MSSLWRRNLTGALTAAVMAALLGAWGVVPALADEAPSEDVELTTLAEEEALDEEEAQALVEEDGEDEAALETMVTKTNLEDVVTSVTFPDRERLEGTKPAYTYTGSPIEPVPVVKIGSHTLTEGVDYAVSYSGQTTEASEYHTAKPWVRISGMGDYTGSLWQEYYIDRRNVNQIDIPSTLPDQEYVYGGPMPKPTVAYNSVPLVEGGSEDYLLIYSNNTNVGTGKVTVRGEGNFCGEKVVTFKITPRSISNVTIEGVPEEVPYNPTPLKPTNLKVYDEGNLIKNYEGQTPNYTITGPTDNGNGTYSLTIKGGHNYTGTKRVTYRIVPRNMSDVVVGRKNSTIIKYSGTAKTPAVYASVGGKYLTEGVDYTVSYSNNVNVGTGTATLTGKGHYTGTATVKFKIKEASLNGIKMTGLPKTMGYTGTARKPKPTIKVGGRKLVLGKDYKLTYKNNVKVGEARVIATGIGNYTGVSNGAFRIVKGKPTITASTVTVQYGKTAKVGAKVTKGAGKITYTSANTRIATVNKSTGVVTGKKIGTTKIKISVAARGSFLATSKTITVKVVKRTNTLTAKATKAEIVITEEDLAKGILPPINNVTVSKPVGKVTYANASTDETAMNFAVAASTGKVTVPGDTPNGTYEVKIKVTAAGNSIYKAGTKTVTYKVIVEGPEIATS